MGKRSKLNIQIFQNTLSAQINVDCNFIASFREASFGGKMAVKL